MSVEKDSLLLTGRMELSGTSKSVSTQRPFILLSVGEA